MHVQRAYFDEILRNFAQQNNLSWFHIAAVMEFKPRVKAVEIDFENF